MSLLTKALGFKFGTPSSCGFALLGRRQDMRQLTGLVDELQRPAEPREAKNYYPTYPALKTCSEFR